MKNMLIIGLGMLILLVLPTTYAITVSYETSSVSRILGNSPEDLIHQLDVEELNLNHATYYAEKENSIFSLFNKRTDPVKALFDDYDINTFWAYENMDLNDFQSNELFVIEGDGKLEEDNIISTHERISKLTTDDVDDWKQDFADHYPFFIFDSDYAGLAIPKQDSYVNKLTKYNEYE